MLPSTVEPRSLFAALFSSKADLLMKVFLDLDHVIVLIQMPTVIITAFIYFSQGSPISPLRTVINRSPVHPKNYKIQYNSKILKRKFTHYNIAKTSIKEVKISSWPRRKPN